MQGLSTVSMEQEVGILKRHWAPLLGLNALIWSVVAYSMIQTPQVWVARASLIVPNATSNLQTNLGKLGNLDSGNGVVFSQQLNLLKILGAIATSNETLKIAWSQDPDKGEYPQLETYKGLFDVSPESESTILSLQVQGDHPEIAQQRATLFIGAFEQRLNQLRNSDATQQAAFRQKELEAARQSWEKSQNTLKQFQQKTGLVSSTDQTEQLITTINTLKTSYSQTLAEGKAARARVKQLSQVLRLSPQTAVGSLQLGEDPTYQRLRQRLAEQEVILAEARNQYTDASPQTQAALELRDKLLRQVNAQAARAAQSLKGLNPSMTKESAPLIQQLVVASGDAEALDLQAKQLQQQIQQQNAQLQTLPAQQATLNRLQRQYEVDEGVYNGLVAQVQATRLNAFGTYPSVQVLDSPRVADKPSGTSRRLMLLGGFLSAGFASLALVLFLEGRRSRVNLLRSEKTFLEALPILSRIPHLKELEEEPKTALAHSEVFRSLAATLHAMAFSNSRDRRLLISSTTCGEGKTTVALGLASALTHLGARVLLVDTDWQRFTLTQQLGFSCSGDLDTLPLPMPVQNQIDFLPMSLRNEALGEFIPKNSFKKTLDFAQSIYHYDYVIIDGTPLNAFKEADLMVPSSANLLLISADEKHKPELLDESLEQLKRWNDQVMGLVINEGKTSLWRNGDPVPNYLSSAHVE